MYGFGVQHTEEAAAEGEADGVADAEGAVVLHAEVDGALDGRDDVDIVVVSVFFLNMPCDYALLVVKTATISSPDTTAVAMVL